jgi:hypothetical protein
VGRLGPEVIDEMTRLLIEAAVREKRFAAPAMRVDSTVVEADVRWPSDAALAHDAALALAREGAHSQPLPTVEGGVQLWSGEQGPACRWGVGSTDSATTLNVSPPARAGRGKPSAYGLAINRSHVYCVIAIASDRDPTSVATPGAALLLRVVGAAVWSRRELESVGRLPIHCRQPRGSAVAALEPVRRGL